MTDDASGAIWDIAPAIPARKCSICPRTLYSLGNRKKCYHHPPEESPGSYRKKLRRIGTPAAIAELARLPVSEEVRRVERGRRMAHAIAAHFSLTTRDLCRRKPTAKGLWVRNLIIYLLSKDHGVPFARMRDCLGSLNHSKASKAAKDIAEELEYNNELKRTIALLRALY